MCAFFSPIIILIIILIIIILISSSAIPMNLSQRIKAMPYLRIEQSLCCFCRTVGTVTASPIQRWTGAANAQNTHININNYAYSIIIKLYFCNRKWTCGGGEGGGVTIPTSPLKHTHTLHSPSKTHRHNNLPTPHSILASGCTFWYHYFHQYTINTLHCTIVSFPHICKQPTRHRKNWIQVLTSVVYNPVSRLGLVVRRSAGKRKDVGSISRFGSPFSSKIVTYGHCVSWRCPAQLMKH